MTLLLGALASAASRIHEAVLDDGYSVEFIGAKPAPPAPSDGSGGAVAAANPPAAVAAAPAGRFVYELFDFSQAPYAQTFPPERPVPGAPAGAPQLPPRRRQDLVLAALLRGTAAVRRRPDTETAVGAAAPPPPLPPGTPAWSPIRDDFVVVSWPSLQFVVRVLIPTLMRQAACVNRSSAAGAAISDAYAQCINALGAAFEPSFVALAVRPMFLRALGVPCELPQKFRLVAVPAAAGAPATTQQQPVARGANGKPSTVLFSQILLGAAASSADAVRASMTSASIVPGAGGAPVNAASAGEFGGEWPLVLPELAWLRRDSDDNPINWGARRPPPLPAPADGAPAPALTGGVWNAEALLPVFGSGVLACAALSREHVEQALQKLIVFVASNANGWAAAQAALESCVLRAAGGGSATAGAVAEAAAASAGGDPFASQVRAACKECCPSALFCL